VIKMAETRTDEVFGTRKGPSPIRRNSRRNIINPTVRTTMP
jgi:hypothetical protein